MICVCCTVVYSHVRRKVVLSGGGNEVTEHEAELMEAQTSPGHFSTELHSSARLLVEAIGK